MSTVWWRTLFTVNVVLLVLLAMSLPFVERGTATFVITVTSLAFILVSLVVLAVLIRVGWDPFEADYRNN